MKAHEGPEPEEIERVLARLDARIEQIAARYETPRAALLPVLHLLQKEFRWLSPPVQRAVAFRLKMSPAEVHGVVEFYSLLRRRFAGRHVIQVCRSLPCELAGARRIVEALCAKLGIGPGKMTPDGRFAVEEVECLGWCHKAPVVQVDDGDYLDRMTPEDARELLEKLEKPRHE